jgi:hypothetical protein
MRFTPPSDTRSAAGLDELVSSGNLNTRPRVSVPPPAPLGDRGVADVAGGATRTGSAMPDDDYGLPKAPEAFDQKKVFDEILALQGPAPKFASMSAEKKAARRSDDFNSLLAQIGLNIAGGGSQFALENVGKGAAAAMPAMQEAMNSRRADEKEERQAQFEQEKTEYGARGTAAAATRAEQNTMREYGLNLAQARAKIANDKEARKIEKAQLGISATNAANLADFYKKDQRQIADLAKVIRRRDPKISQAEAEYQAYNRVLPGAGSFANKPMTYAAARAQAAKEAKEQFKFAEAAPAGWIDSKAEEILKRSYSGYGGETSDLGYDPSLWGQPVKK